MHADFALINEKLAGFKDPARYFEHWSGFAQDWLMTNYSPKKPSDISAGSLDPEEEELYPLSTRSLLGWRFDSDEDDRQPTDRQAPICQLEVIAPGIVTFKAYQENGDDFDLFGLVEQTHSNPFCYRIHLADTSTIRMLHLVGRDPDNSLSLYNEAVYAYGDGYGCHMLISDADWTDICAWLSKWLEVPVTADAG